VGRGRRAPAGPHDHADAAPAERLEDGLVGEVVPDVDRDRAACVERVEQPEDRPALVPVERGTQLEDLLSARLAERRVAREDGADRATSASATRRKWAAIVKRLRSTSAPATPASAGRSSASARSSSGSRSTATSRRMPDGGGPAMSNPWLPTYPTSGRPTSRSTAFRSRPLTMVTGQQRARRRTRVRVPSASTASSGRGTIGVSVPS
jgi:hypothetical protein